MNTPVIPKHHQQWFTQLKLAASNGDLALMSCLDAQTKEPRTVLCIASQADDGGTEFIPLGHFVPEGNPFDAYIPPD
jgi:hypothetical protein